MSPSRRTRRPSRPTLRRKGRQGVLILLCLALAAPLAYALARSVASASRQTADSAAAKEKQRAFVPGEILVRFRVGSKVAGASSESGRDVTSLRLAEGRKIPVEFETPRGLQVVRGLRLARVSPAETLAAVESLRARADVVYAEPNYVRRKLATPSTPGRSTARPCWPTAPCGLGAATARVSSATARASTGVRP